MRGDGIRDVLVFVHINTHFCEQIRVARLLAHSSSYRPVVLFNREYQGWENDAATCAREGIDLLTRGMATGRERGPIFPGAELSTLPKPRGPRIKHPPWVRAKGFAHFLLHRVVLRNFIRAGWLIYRTLKPLRALFYQFIVLPLGSDRRTACNGQPNRVRDALAASGRMASRMFWAIGVPWVRMAWARHPGLLPYTVRYLHREFEFARILFERHEFALMVLPEDNLFYQTAKFIDVAREHGCPTVVVPFTIANVLEWAEAFYVTPEYSVDTLLNFGISRRFPQWTFTHKGHAMTMTPSLVMANTFDALTPPIPWLVNSGAADAIAAESPYMFEYYKAAGIAPSSLVLTGALYDDEVHAVLTQADERRNELYAELGLPAGKPMLLCALPPDQLTGHGRPGCEFASYEAIVRYWAEILGQCEGFNVIVNLHPRTSYESVRYMEEYGIVFCRANIASLVPLCDLFVASVSATIRMAIACGHPVINYDVYRYRYDDYAQAAGVLTLEDSDTFAREVRRATEEPSYLAEIRRAQRAGMHHWAFMDGRSGERMLALFDRLAGVESGERHRRADSVEQTPPLPVRSSMAGAG